MITQKAISAKIDTELLERLDTALRESSRYYATRNNAINKALEMYVELIKMEENPEGLTDDMARRYMDKCHKIYWRWR